MNRYKFVRTVTRGRAEVTFEPTQGGARAAYLVSWVSATRRAGAVGGDGHGHRRSVGTRGACAGLFRVGPVPVLLGDGPDL